MEYLVYLFFSCLILLGLNQYCAYKSKKKIHKFFKENK